MENVGKEPDIVHGTIHGPGYSGAGAIGGKHQLAKGRRLADDFHVYAVQWSPDRIAFSIDGTEYFEVTPARLPQGAKWVFDHPFFLLVNLAVGGRWPGYPDETTTFPQMMKIDWVRVWQRR
jgi:beta-glucanase (GH16 family)